MRAKKAKRIRQECRAFARRLEADADIKIFDRGYISKPTAKIIGWKERPEWIRANFLRLIEVGGPWYQEMLNQVIPVHAQMIVVNPRTLRGLIKRAKKSLRQ